MFNAGNFYAERSADGGLNYFKRVDNGTSSQLAPINREEFFSNNPEMDEQSVMGSMQDQMDSGQVANANGLNGDGSPMYSRPADEDAPASTGAGSATAGYNSADENAFNNDQIDAINRLIGTTNSKLTSGMANIGNSYKSQNERLADQKAKTMSGYDLQETENSQDKQKGIEGVDNFTNTSYKSLMRLLGGAGAGNSSVARTVIPTLVSKAGSTRRSGVFDTAGRNERDISTARADANDQFSFSQEDLDNWKTGQEKTLNEGAGSQLTDLLGKRKTYEMTKAQLNNPDFAANAVATGATHNGYLAAKSAGANTQAEIDQRMADLDRLFGNYNPTYTARQTNLKTPELSKFTVDPASIKADQNLPAESAVYLPLLKKKQQLSIA